MEYDYSNLCGAITRCFGTQAKFADALGISERSLSLKINNKVGWKQDEMIKTTKKLDNFMDWNLLNQNNYQRVMRVLGVTEHE